MPLGQHFNSGGVVKALQSQVVSGTECSKTSIQIEIFRNPIDFPLNDPLHFQWSMQHKCRALRRAAFPFSHFPEASTLFSNHTACHYVGAQTLIYFFFLFFFLRSASVVEKPFYGKLCCILSGNDAHPAASHPGHKMATPPFVFLSPKNICIFISKTKHQLPAGKRQTANGMKK